MYGVAGDENASGDKVRVPGFGLIAEHTNFVSVALLESENKNQI